MARRFDNFPRKMELMDDATTELIRTINDNDDVSGFNEILRSIDLPRVIDIDPETRFSIGRMAMMSQNYDFIGWLIDQGMSDSLEWVLPEFIQDKQLVDYLITRGIYPEVAQVVELGREDLLNHYINSGVPIEEIVGEMIDSNNPEMLNHPTAELLREIFRTRKPELINLFVNSGALFPPEALSYAIDLGDFSLVEEILQRPEIRELDKTSYLMRTENLQIIERLLQDDRLSKR